VPAILVGLVAFVVLAVAILSAVGASRTRRLYQAEKEDLLRRAQSAPPSRADAGAASRLPAPVQKYLRVTGAVGKTVFRTVILRQTGAIRTAADKPWMPFEAEQVYSMAPPGFLWLARARVAPLVSLWARDKFVDGRGNMLVRLLGVFTVVDGKGPEIDQGAGLRFWGELVSFPEAVLNPSMKWRPLDDRRVTLVVEQDGLLMEGVIVFDAESLPASFHARRYRDVGGKGVLTAWSGHTTNWKTIDGRLFPTHWESVWHLEEGDLTAVKIDILSVRTD
jgi:hypothetical protein